MSTNLTDLGNERALLSCIIKHGKDAFIDASSFVTTKDFSLSTNQAIWQCLESLYNDEYFIGFDTDSIKIKAKQLNLDSHFKGKKELEYLELLNIGNFSKENINAFAMQIKKLSISRDLHSRYIDAADYIGKISGTESLSEIISGAEGKIVDFVTGIDNQNQLTQLNSNIEDYIISLLDKEPVDQIGIPTGFPVWDNAIGGGPRRGTISVIAARPKCVNSKETYLLTSKGILSIAELHDHINDDTEDNVDYTVANQNNEMVKPQLWFNSYEQNTIIFETQTGNKIEVTPEHPIKVYENDVEVWKLAKNITLDDKFIIKTNTNIFGNNEIDLEDAYVYGCLTGDGYVCKRKNEVSLTNKDAVIINAFKKYAKKYKYRISKTTKVNKDGGLNKASSYYLRDNPSLLKDTFNGKFYNDKELKIIPLFIRQCKKEVICSYIRGLFDTDGCVLTRCISLTTKSYDLAQQLKIILNNLGIRSSVRIKMAKINNKKLPYYDVNIGRYDSIIKYKNLIGFSLQYKQRKLINTCKNIQYIKGNTLFNHKECISLLKNLKNEIYNNNILLKSIMPFDSLNRWIRRARNITCVKLTKFVEKIETALGTTDTITRIKEIAQTSDYLDRIKKISYGKSFVSDYQIPPECSFISNSFISHNCSKSFLAMNMGRNIAKIGIPVLYLDTELTESYQKDRLLSITSRMSNKKIRNWTI